MKCDDECYEHFGCTNRYAQKYDGEILISWGRARYVSYCTISYNHLILGLQLYKVASREMFL